MTAIQIRNVPEATSRALKARAAAAGLSLSDFLLGELERIASRPPQHEVLARVAARGRLDLEPAADALAAERAERS